MKINNNDFDGTSRIHFGGIPEGVDALTITDIAGALPGRAVIHVARDDKRLSAVSEALTAFSPTVTVLQFPAWDCLPYDRVSPNSDVTGRRLHTLIRLTNRNGNDNSTPLVVLTTVNAVLQRVPAQNLFKNAVFQAATGNQINVNSLSKFLADNGYNRTGTVREPGEVAFRGGIVDIFPPGMPMPVRLDLFGDEVEEIRRFDPVDQRSLDAIEKISLEPVREFMLDEASISRFREGYRHRFGSIVDDPLYDAVTEGRVTAGIEHWLPLLNDGLETIFDYLPGSVLTFDHQAIDAIAARHETIQDFYDARMSFLQTTAKAKKNVENAPIYRPLPPNELYLTEKSWRVVLKNHPNCWFSPFSSPTDTSSSNFDQILDAGGKRAPEFSSARAALTVNKDADANTPGLFASVNQTIKNEQGNNRRVAIAAYSTGSRDRLVAMLKEHGGQDFAELDSWAAFSKLSASTIGLFVLGVEHGFKLDKATIIGEQDILGERMVRPQRRRRADTFITDTSELTAGDFVVHIEHGIGCYEGLETITAGGAPHDCLRLSYSSNVRLFVPVENIEVLTRYGSADSGAVLDKLGGAGWQSRKAKVKNRLENMAEALIKVAAERALRPGRKLSPQDGIYQEFCARFPYSETDDQLRAIADVVADLVGSKPMDRLICGDVGFGKTEIALRAAFSAVMAGGQVAIVAPTTLLCRQHFATFNERFQGYPVRIGQLSRMVSTSDATETKEGITDGTVDIVIGTHALLGKSIKFKDLALLIVDEEQHFGVAHKEQLKQIRNDVHVLTLTATPIPRTLQLALSGVKEMSIIATPPVDRLAVRTFILPFDPLIVREAIMRERFRGGQIFYVCPRIADIEELEKELRELVPDLKIAVAHGQMGAGALEDIMTGFYEGRTELLLSTQIVESGLDIPTANTLFIHRADRFGLAQLYQLRGRIGRSKQRAYCYLTIPADARMTPAASKRLEVMQSLDSLGAGFKLASHDLDIRGAGNLLGDEQSGHIREVGVELYQHMLEEAVANAKGGITEADDTGWSPQINIGTPVLIPEKYVTDLDARLGLYRRLAGLNETKEIESFAAELIDRFGPLPIEVENLLQIILIKQHCRRAGVAKLDAGPKGLIISFHNDHFTNPGALIGLIQEEPGRLSLRPDHRLVMRRDWEKENTRLRGVRQFVTKLANMAGEEDD